MVMLNCRACQAPIQNSSDSQMCSSCANIDVTPNPEQKCSDSKKTLGKRKRAAPPKTSSKEAQNKRKPVVNSTPESPFEGVFLAELFRPIFAADKLCVLSQQNCDYLVILKKKDLKALNQEKRDLLLKESSDLEDDLGPEEVKDTLPESLNTIEKKRKRKQKSSFSLQRQRKSTSSL